MRSTASFAVRTKTRPYAFSTDHPVVLITRAMSFLGRALIESLKTQPVNLLLIDHSIPKHDATIARLMLEPNIRFLAHDVAEPLPPTLPNPTYIVHIPPDRRGTIPGTQRMVDLAIRSRARLAVITHALQPEPERAQHHGAWLRVAELLVEDAGAQHDLDARIIRLPDVYGPNMPTDAPNILGHLFHQAVHAGRITLPGDGLVSLFPLYISDAVAGIITALFAKDTRGKVYTLFPHHHTTTLHVAHVVRHMLSPRRRIEIVFDEHKKLPLRTHHPSDTELAWKPTIDLEEGIAHTLHFPLPLPKRQPVPKQKKRHASSERRQQTHLPSRTTPRQPRLWPHSPRFLFLFVLVGLGGFVFFSIAQLMSTVFFGAFVLGDFSNELLQANAPSIVRVQRAADVLETTASIVRATMQLPSSYGAVTQAGAEVARARIGLYRAGDYLQQLLAAIASPGSGGVSDVFTSMQSELDIADFHLGTAQALFAAAEGDPPPLLSSKKLHSLRNQVMGLRDDLQGARTMATTLIPLLGVRQPASYLVLFQDNTVMRPGGGIVRSIGRINTSQGHILDFSVDAVSVIDGQRQSTIEMPASIQRVLGGEQWSLQESNWWAHFPQTASASRFVFRETLGQDVDGVIALDQDALRRLLMITGPVALPGYGVDISAENIDVEMDRYGEDDFLGRVGREVVNAIVAFEQEEWFVLGATLRDLFAEKHLMISSSDPLLASALATEGWDGAWSAWVQKGEGQQIYPAAVVLANIGKQRLGQWAEYNIDRSVTLAEDGRMTEEIGVVIDGAQTYVRFAIPQSATITAVRLDGKDISYDEEQFPYWRTVGLVASSSAQQRVRASIRIRHNEKVGLETTQLQFIQMKQPGTDAIPLVTTLTLPSTVTPMKVRPTASTEGERLVWEMDLRRDRAIEINLGEVAGAEVR